MYRKYGVSVYGFWVSLIFLDNREYSAYITERETPVN